MLVPKFRSLRIQEFFKLFELIDLQQRIQMCQLPGPIEMVERVCEFLTHRFQFRLFRLFKEGHIRVDGRIVVPLFVVALAEKDPCDPAGLWMLSTTTTNCVPSSRMATPRSKMYPESSCSIASGKRAAPFNLAHSSTIPGKDAIFNSGLFISRATGSYITLSTSWGMTSSVWL